MTIQENDIAYKLLTRDRTSHNDCKWEVGEWKETEGKGDLCGPGWLHFYSHPLLAVLLNPLHGNMTDPVLWECETDGARQDDRGLKHGRTRARIMRELPLPVITTAQRVRFAILCSLAVTQTDKHKAWAAKWLDGTDRARQSADSAAAYAPYAAAADSAAAYAAASAYSSASAAAYAAAAYAADSAAADSAASAYSSASAYSYSAVYSAYSASAAASAYASAASGAASAAASAAYAAASAAYAIDLIALAEQAIREEKA